VHSERETTDSTTADGGPDGRPADGPAGSGPAVGGGSDALAGADLGRDSADRRRDAAASAAVGDADLTDPGTATDPDTDPAPRGRRRVAALLVVAALALLLDIASKMLVVAHLSDRGPVRLPGGFLRLTLIRNSGAAFSIGESQTWVFTIIAAAVVVVILRISRNLRSLAWAGALGLLLGGALGNLADRIFRSPGLFRGHVVDFLQFPRFPVVDYDFPVFNLADSAIVVGGCLMVLLSFLGRQPDGTRHLKSDETDGAPAD
jgi:signal peptidase II